MGEEEGVVGEGEGYKGVRGEEVDYGEDQFGGEGVKGVTVGGVCVCGGV